MRIVVVASTGGSVVSHAAARSPWFRSALHHVVTDRPCGAYEWAGAAGVPRTMLAGLDRPAFSDALLAHLDDHGADLVFLFFTRLLEGPLLHRYAGRIVNLHPSLLPAGKGLDGFGDTVRSGARFAGATVHLVDAGMDTGPIIQQSIVPFGPADDVVRVRHRIFEQQCRSLIQVARWFADGRVRWEGEGPVTVEGASCGDPEFCPALDFEDALALRIDPPSPDGGWPRR